MSADPTGEKAKAVKARYVGVCRDCGAYTQPRNGKGDAYAYCKACHPGAIEARWTRERVLAAMAEWRSRYGRLPSSYDWSRTHARAPARGRCPRATCRKRVAISERRYLALRNMDRRLRRGAASGGGGCPEEQSPSAACCRQRCSFCLEATAPLRMTALSIALSLIVRSGSLSRHGKHDQLTRSNARDDQRRRRGAPLTRWRHGTSRSRSTSPCGRCR